MKKHIRNILALVTFVCLAFGNYPMAVLLFAATALMAGPNLSNVFAVCATSCEVADIESSDDCNIRGGLKVAYWAQYNDIDWDAMTTDPAAFDPVNQCILAYTMVDGATWKKLSFDRKLGSYNFTYTEDTDLYEQVITMVFEGKSKENRNAFCKAIGCCKLVLHLFDNNCQSRVVGVEWDGQSFEPQVTTLRFGRHLDSSGEFGSTKARDEIDFTGESICPPMFSELEQSTLPV